MSAQRIGGIGRAAFAVALCWSALLATTGCRQPDPADAAAAIHGRPGDHLARAVANGGLTIEPLYFEPVGDSTDTGAGATEAVVTLPADLAQALDELDWVRGAVKWNGLCDVEPRGRAAAAPEAVREDSTRVLAALYSEELAPRPHEWKAYEIPGGASEPETDWHPLLRARLDVEMTGLPGAARAPVAGTAFRGQNQAGLLLHIEGGSKDTADGVPFAARFCASVLRWPLGTGEAGTVTCREIAGGTEWTHRPPPPVDGHGPMDLRSMQLWPWTVKCWSDGEWLLVYALPTAGYGGWEAASPPRPPSLLDPARPLAASHHLESLEKSFDVRCPAAGVATLTRELFMAKPMSAPAEGDLVSVVNRTEQPLAKHGLRMRPEAEWARGAPAPVPATARVYLNVPEGTESWQISFTGDPFFGNGAAGLLEVGPDAPTHAEPALVQWVLGERHSALTVANRDRGWRLLHPVPGAHDSLLGRAPGDLAKVLGAYCGEYGWRIAFSPTTWKGGWGPGGFYYTPVTDAPYGFLGEQTVGDQPWGRFVIYDDQLVFHIVFELPKKAAAG